MRNKGGRSTRDMATATGMSSDFFLKEIADGALKAVRFGREWRIPNEEAERYLEARGWPIPPEWQGRVVGPIASNHAP